MLKGFFTYLVLLVVLSCPGLCDRTIQERDVTNCVTSNTTASAWAPNVAYAGASLVRYNGILYECLQAHESEQDWTPPATPDLWATPTPCGITPWETQTLYQVGSEVTYNGVTYICIQAHESESGWTPDQTPALWQPSSAGSSAYQPPLPTNYSACVYDPATGGPFNLIDPQGLPIINNGSKAAEAAQVIENLDPYTFSHPSGAPMGVYDIVLTSSGQQLYLAVFKSGSVGFVAKSSNGQQYVDSGAGDQYITSIWSVDCTGFTTAGIVGGVGFSFSINSDGDVIVTTTPPGSQKVRRDIPVPQGFYVYPISFPSWPSGTRCADGQTAVTKNPPVPLTPNGCGSPQFKVDDRDFLHCCNAHDVCWGECDQSYGGCNDNFYSCMKNTCDTLYTGYDNWKCRFFAGAYYLGVNNPIAASRFTDVSDEFCDCECGDPSLTACGDSCVDLVTDPNNCGSCYFYCPTGSCTNGACSFDSCAGQTCDTFGPCGPGGSCVCASITDGTGFCVDGTTPCEGLEECGTSADCPLGSVCAVSTCCDTNVCITTDQCGGYDNNIKMLFARDWTEATIASPPKWVD